MAYVDQTKKAKIAAALKAVIPSGWKYSLAVQHHSTIVCTISAAPFDLIGAMQASEYFDPATADHATVNTFHTRTAFSDQCVADVFEKIVAALNTGNHDRSDSMTDYFDVGHYVGLSIGRWNKPFICTAPATAQAVAA